MSKLTILVDDVKVMEFEGTQVLLPPIEPQPAYDPRMEPYFQHDLMHLHTQVLSGEFHNTWPEWWSWDAYNRHNIRGEKYQGPQLPAPGDGDPQVFLLERAGQRTWVEGPAGASFVVNFRVPPGGRAQISTGATQSRLGYAARVKLTVLGSGFRGSESLNDGMNAVYFNAMPGELHRAIIDLIDAGKVHVQLN